MDASINDALGAALLHSLPVAVIALDGQCSLRAANPAARRLLGLVDGTTPGGGFGDVTRCVNALGSEKGCGSSAECDSCVIRCAALQAVAGEQVDQREATVRVRQETEEVDRVFLVSAAPVDGKGTDVRALMVLQDITALHKLRGLIPICSGCNKIRRDDAAWERLEQFIETHSYAVFTHSLCPPCAAALYPDLG